MNLLGSSYHINHLTACLRNFFEIKLEIAHEIAAVEALFRYFGPKRFRFFFSNYFTFSNYTGNMIISVGFEAFSCK